VSGLRNLAGSKAVLLVCGPGQSPPAVWLLTSRHSPAASTSREARACSAQGQHNSSATATHQLHSPAQHTHLVDVQVREHCNVLARIHCLLDALGQQRSEALDVGLVGGLAAAPVIPVARVARDSVRCGAAAAAAIAAAAAALCSVDSTSCLPPTHTPSLPPTQPQLKLTGSSRSRSVPPALAASRCKTGGLLVPQARGWPACGPRRLLLRRMLAGVSGGAAAGCTPVSTRRPRHPAAAKKTPSPQPPHPAAQKCPACARLGAPVAAGQPPKAPPLPHRYLAV
jgi:hypothetical protein